MDKEVKKSSVTYVREPQVSTVSGPRQIGIAT